MFSAWEITANMQSKFALALGNDRWRWHGTLNLPMLLADCYRISSE